MISTWSGITATTEFSNIARAVLTRYDLAGGKTSARRIDVVDVVQHIWCELYDHGKRIDNKKYPGIINIPEDKKWSWNKKPPRWLQTFAWRHAQKYVMKEITLRKHVRLFSDLR